MSKITLEPYTNHMINSPLMYRSNNTAYYWLICFMRLNPVEAQVFVGG